VVPYGRARPRPAPGQVVNAHLGVSTGEIQRRNSPTQPISAHLDIDTPVRIPVDELDIFQTGADLVCTQIRSRKRVTISGAAARLLEPHMRGNAFRLANFKDDVKARALVHNLGAVSILIPAGNDG